MSPRLDRRNPRAATAIRSALTARLGARLVSVSRETGLAD
jgi:hypothetical protein